MNYHECDFDDPKQVALLYELTDKTVRAWNRKSTHPVPWRDPWAVLEWYQMIFERKPNARIHERVKILGPQMARWEQEQKEKRDQETQPGGQDGVAGDPQTGVHWPFETDARRGDPAELMAAVAQEVVVSEAMPGTADQRQWFEELVADLSNARTVARIASEEREAYENYRVKKDNGLDHGMELRRWQDLTKTKREWAKTEDAVQLAFKLLRNWLRSEWEVTWKELRTALDGRRLGMEMREELMAVSADPVEWRRLWDMGMERVILTVLDREGVDNG